MKYYTAKFQLVGNLIYLTTTTPDINFVVSMLSRFLNCPKETHWIATKRVLRNIKDPLHFGIVLEKKWKLYIEWFFKCRLDMGCRWDKVHSMLCLWSLVVKCFHGELTRKLQWPFHQQNRVQSDYLSDLWGSVVTLDFMRFETSTYATNDFTLWQSKCNDDKESNFPFQNKTCKSSSSLHQEQVHNKVSIQKQNM